METKQAGKPIPEAIRARLDNFRVFRALAFDSRKMGALTLNDFSNLVRGTNWVLTNEEKSAMPQKEFGETVRGCFLYLDSDKDGLLSPKDADKDGFITDFSRAKAMYDRILEGGKAYSIEWKTEPDSIAKASAQFMLKRREEVKKSRKVIPNADKFIYCYDVPMFNLCPEQQDTTILQLSDLHFNKSGRKNPQKIEFLNNLKDKIAKPDIVLVTGDLIDDVAGDFVDGAKKALSDVFKEAKRYFVLGNHDFRNGAAKSVAEAMENAGYVDITNRHLVVDVKGKPFGITGVDDYSHMCQVGVRFVPQIPDEHTLFPNILATHNLDSVDGSFPRCFGVVFTGHTHLGEKDFILFDYADLLELIGAYRNVNGQKDEWGIASLMTFLHISSGLATHTTRRFATPEGASLITLKYDL